MFLTTLREQGGFKTLTLWNIYTLQKWVHYMWKNLSGFPLISRIHWLGFSRPFQLKLFSGGFLLKSPSCGERGEKSWGYLFLTLFAFWLFFL